MIKNIEKLCSKAGIPKYPLSIFDFPDDWGPLKAKNNRPVIVFGNGPSVREIDYRRWPDNPVIFRANYFYKEDYFYGGKHVDAFFFGGDSGLVKDISWLYQNKEYYEIDHLVTNTGLLQRKSDYSNIDIGEKLYEYLPPILNVDILRDQLIPYFDSVMRSETEINRKEDYFSRTQSISSLKLPTSGTNAILTAALLGFNEIYIVGVDHQLEKNKKSGKWLYSGGDSYLYPQENGLAGLTFEDFDREESIFWPGYTHSLRIELFTIEFIKKFFPGCRLYSLVDINYLGEKVLPLAEINPNADFKLVKSNFNFETRKEEIRETAIPFLNSFSEELYG